MCIIDNLMCMFYRSDYIKYKGKNTVLVPIFWVHSQFSPYTLVAVNLVLLFSTCDQFDLYR